MVPTIRGIPVLLPAHDHPDFGDPGLHYHIDYRYCSDKPEQSRVIFSDEEPVMMDLPKVREVYITESSSLNLAHVLASRYDKASCGRCPHKGLEIIDGVCPGHSMAFNPDGSVIKDYYLSLFGILRKYEGTHLIYEFESNVETEVSEVDIVAGGKVKIGCLRLGPIVVKPFDLIKVSIR
jgi:hypothetical protein